MKSTLTWKKDFQSEVTNGRGHSVSLDLPEDKGGKNNGTTALELCVMSFNGCLSTIFAVMAQKMRLSYESLQIEMVAEQAGNAPTITDIHCEMYIKSQDDHAKIEDCIAKSIAHCPVGMIFSKAGITISHDVIFQ